MTKFEQVGINFQYDAATKEQAIKIFKRSCDICCHTGHNIICDKCNIAAVHNMIIAYFDDKEQEARIS